MTKRVLNYDGSFEGFLTCVFNAYEQKLLVVEIIPAGENQNQLFSKTETIITEDLKAQRVLKALKTKMSIQGLRRIKFAFLSEKPGIEFRLYEMIRYIFSMPEKAELDYSHPVVLDVSKTAKQVGREKHRMEAFVRFRLTKDNIYFAIIEPDFNVLPIITPHFKSRYADQKWLIYDVKRKYGVYYDLSKTEYISIDLPKDIGVSGGNSEYFEAGEIYFQKLWKEYFDSTNIKSRVNMRLHVQHVPKRYWKYLSEKSPFA
ncbi:TIGR03915 family putative DNA repair protein [Christiangramia sediminis]|uniref:TIGR03915 family putative DNA repair protein n=1 Tax=Christiangramia sediminis TaxID=2881336 RepID=A0A9X1LLL4_9FLAO|nr:TIGR03915 family putative DNA repair protein [Christiangramia sediminis]MCB7482563.1 TIGR03915 family putative DNA repair protein [Christiangramia sediminis]